MRSEFTRRRILIVAASIFIGTAVSCNVLTPNRQLITRSGEQTYLTNNTDQVRSILANHGALDTDMDVQRAHEAAFKSASQDIASAKYPDTVFAARRELVRQMTDLSGRTVDGGTYLRILRKSNAICTTHWLDTSSYLLVRITSGSQAGREGWICGLSVARTVAMP